MICGCNVYGYHKASLPPFRPGGKTVTRNGYGRLDGRMDKFLDLFTMEGRANRAWYFWHIILDDLAILTAIAMCAGLVFVTGSPLFILPGLGAVVAGLWAGIAITVKRLHDLDRPGWHWFLLGGVDVGAGGGFGCFEMHNLGQHQRSAVPPEEA